MGAGRRRLGRADRAQVGYHIGTRGGRALLERTRRPKLHEAVERAQHLFERYGHGRAIVLARFLSIVRTVLNPVAGAVAVSLRMFVRWLSHSPHRWPP